MINSKDAISAAEELTKRLNGTLEKLSDEYGNLVIKIDIVKIKKKGAILKIDVVTKDGKIVLPFNQFNVMAGDSINLTFGDHKLQLKDIIKILI